MVNQHTKQDKGLLIVVEKIKWVVMSYIWQVELF